MKMFINQFMEIYMFELEIYLTGFKNELLSMSFQSDEANTDRPLKEYLKSKIESSFNKIPSSSFIYSSTDNTYSILKNIVIEKVLLPDELTITIKETLSQYKHAVYTNPDLCLQLNIDGNVYYETVELKSTKQDSIPGSSIQQITPHEWVIFIKHTSTDIEIITGQYIHAINSKMQFPDRSPRPQVSFKELERWNKKHRIITDNSLLYLPDPDEHIKYDLINDWQTFLASKWLDILFHSNSIKSNEPWFNNNLRKFILLFLNQYDNLSEEEKISFKNKINSLIIK